MTLIKRLLFVVVILVAAAIVYLLVAPVAITPAAWTPPPAPTLTGQYEQNSRLQKVERLAAGDGHKPEDVALDSAGRIYTGFEDGRIIQLQSDGTQPKVFADTKGRPLGLIFDSVGNLIVADAISGLLSIDPKGGMKTLSKGIDGRSYGCLNDLDIAKDGTIYFTEASSKYPMSAFTSDILEHQPNGRLLAYDPKTGTVRTVLERLYFANGVAISPDQSFVLVAETGMYRVRRVWLTGSKQGQAEDLISNLPGFPDGISSNGRDKFWLALVTPRDPVFDKVLPHPFLRKVIARLPRFLQPAPKRYSFVLGLDHDGRVIENLQNGAPNGYAQIANVVEHEGSLFFGSIGENTVGRFDLQTSKENR
jgi:sugar lactone lactonase YvrE